MVRSLIAFLVGLWAAGLCPAASWADMMFDELSHDFGSVPRGPALTYAFRLTNRTGKPLHIASTRVSCGCTTATVAQNQVPPGGTTAIVAQMDSRRFSGPKTVTIYVQFDAPHWEEVRLWVQANSRDDITLMPDTLTVGRAKRGSSPSASVQVVLFGDYDWRIIDSRCDSNYVKIKLSELQRDAGETIYQVTARIRPDTPVGKWYTDVWLTTTNPLTPKIRIPLTVEIESALSVSPSATFLGDVKVGTEAERRVIIRGVQPFRVIQITGTDAELTVKDTAPVAKPIHVLTVKLKAKTAGDMLRTLRIFTDLKEDGEVDFQAKAHIVP